MAEDHDHEDISFRTSSSIDLIDIPLKNTDFNSSLDTYSNVFDKNRHNFSASSEIPFINQNNDQPLSTEYNRTFTKEVSKTIINAFTGKPISPNPWRKLCTKNIQRQIETDIAMSNDILSPNLQTVELQPAPLDQFNNQPVRHSRKDMVHNQRAKDSSIEDEAFEQFLQGHQSPTAIQQQNITPIHRRRKKRNSQRDSIDKLSSSSEEIVKVPQFATPTKTSPFIRDDPSWHRLADVYTSEDSDEKTHLLSANLNYSLHLKSEVYTSDQSSSSSSSSSKVDSRLSATGSDRKTIFNFLQSLAENIPFEQKHPNAQPYFMHSDFNLKNKRQELADKLFTLYNQDVFSSKLSDKVTVVWSGRLTATAGHCTTRKATRTAVITLSHKVCDSPERCRDTLLHEMCHAAVTLIDGVMEYGHGPLWRQWTSIAAKSYPYLPPISVRHTYDVAYRFIYRCGQCLHEVYRHSKSLDLEVDYCGKCMGKFDLITNGIKDETQTPKKAANKYNLFVKENFQAVKQANPHLSTPQLMRQLSKEYKLQNEQQKMIDLPNFDQLKL
ncbi:unnamed protein product [Adineta ricciae]|uniref:SprT-like domain-containing protein n=1 Tax=Adineta ricciae TaxID=249248 RepID=A0A814FTD6_ADIRI|nr:unnamed protein product [Adineta ricciae]CAF1580120.1 unnamed protein product [Adineta ricciae]